MEKIRAHDHGNRSIFLTDNMLSTGNVSLAVPLAGAVVWRHVAATQVITRQTAVMAKLPRVLD